MFLNNAYKETYYDVFDQIYFDPLKYTQDSYRLRLIDHVHQRVKCNMADIDMLIKSSLDTFILRSVSVKLQTYEFF
jgi:hypothetical protein